MGEIYLKLIFYFYFLFIPLSRQSEALYLKATFLKQQMFSDMPKDCFPVEVYYLFFCFFYEEMNETRTAW